eukprot:11215910-Lingulodinium_polyedra.AAC.1
MEVAPVCRRHPLRYGGRPVLRWPTRGHNSQCRHCCRRCHWLGHRSDGFESTPRCLPSHLCDVRRALARAFRGG